MTAPRGAGAWSRILLLEDGRWSREVIDRPDGPGMTIHVTPITRTRYHLLAMDNIARVVVYVPEARGVRAKP